MQFGVEATRVADRLTLRVPAPESGRARLTVCTGQPDSSGRRLVTKKKTIQSLLLLLQHRVCVFKSGSSD